MDNFRIDITGEGELNLERALLICFAQHRAATHYAVRGEPPAERTDWSGHPKAKRLIFFWADGGKDAVALPFTLDAAGATDFAKRWLAEQDFGEEPDHDGSNGKGWRVYNEAWGHVDGQYQGVVAITPAWAMYGK